MEKLKTKCGYVAYKGIRTEIILVTGGFGVCDMCAKPDKEMYIVPVLNSAMCCKCYEDWNNRAIYYEEDIPFERQFEKVFDKRINEKLED